MTSAQLEAELESLGEKKFRAKQILEWLWQKGAVDFEDMTNLSAALRQKLPEHLQILTGIVDTRCDADDNVVKLLLRWPDGESVETVMIPTGNRATACVSTQVGCAMGCGFCASGMNGFQRNLTTGEILEQIHQLQLATDRRISNIVLMGMGEPLANYDAVIAAVRAMIDPQLGGISARKITLSTVGLPEGIVKLASENLPITLAISLHAPTDELRAKIMPIAVKYPIDDVVEAAAKFFHSRGREITLEYTLLEGVNDSAECIDELIHIADRLRCNVNLIGFNPVSSLPYKPPQSGAMQLFAERLRRQGLNVNIRHSRGLGIDSACGQLRMRKDTPSE